PFAAEPPHRLRALGRTKPSAAETAANGRARSAVLRAAERTAAPFAPPAAAADTAGRAGRRVASRAGATRRLRGSA
ncbi:MAG: hypothetical protein ABI641_13995, partial [Caldimonas sp.]